MKWPQKVVLVVVALLLIFVGLDLIEGDFSDAAISLFLVAVSLIVWEVVPAPWSLKKDQNKLTAGEGPHPPNPYKENLVGTFKESLSRRLATYEVIRALDKRLPLKLLIGIFAVSMVLNVLGVVMLASPIGGYVLLVGFAGTVLIFPVIAIGLWKTK